MLLLRRPGHSGAAVPWGLRCWGGDELGVPGPVGWAAVGAYGTACPAERPGRAGAAEPAPLAASRVNELLAAVVSLAILAVPRPVCPLSIAGPRGRGSSQCFGARASTSLPAMGIAKR